MDRVSGVLQLRQETLDAEGLPTLGLPALDTGTATPDVVLPTSVLDRLDAEDRTAASQALLAYASGEPDQPMPTVTSVAVQLTPGEVTAIVVQVQQQRARSVYSVIWPTGPDGDSLLCEWLQSASHPLTVAVVGLQADLKLNAVRLVAGYRSLALETLDRAIVNLHQQKWTTPHHRPRGPMVRSTRTWFAWLDAMNVVSRGRRVEWRANALARIGEALRGLDAQASVSASSYQTQFQLEKRNQGTHHLRHLLFWLEEQIYTFLTERIAPRE